MSTGPRLHPSRRSTGQARPARAARRTRPGGATPGATSRPGPPGGLGGSRCRSRGSGRRTSASRTGRHPMPGGPVPPRWPGSPGTPGPRAASAGSSRCAGRTIHTSSRRRRGSAPSLRRPEPPPSPPDEAGHGGHELLDLLVALTALQALPYAVPHVIVQEADANGLQRGARRVQLGEDVDAVLVLLHHPLEAPDLALDPAQPVEEILLVHRVAVHARPFQLTIDWEPLLNIPYRGRLGEGPGPNGPHAPGLGAHVAVGILPEVVQASRGAEPVRRAAVFERSRCRPRVHFHPAHRIDLHLDSFPEGTGTPVRERSCQPTERGGPGAHSVLPSRTRRRSSNSSFEISPLVKRSSRMARASDLGVAGWFVPGWFVRRPHSRIA